MSSETFSVLVWCWHDLQTDTTQLRVVRVDTGEKVYLSESSFLLRVSTEKDGKVLRCFIRHIASGREAYIQSSAKLRAFVKDCLLKSDENMPAPPDSPGE